jgi:hypothetical protein
MVQMAASSKINFYFCNVKSNKRHEVAAKKQRFLCPNFINKNVAVSSVVAVMPTRFRLENLTARNTASFMSKFI